MCYLAILPGRQSCPACFIKSPRVRGTGQVVLGLTSLVSLLTSSSPLRTSHPPALSAYSGVGRLSSPNQPSSAAVMTAPTPQQPSCQLWEAELNAASSHPQPLPRGLSADTQAPTSSPPVRRPRSRPSQEAGKQRS